MQGFCDGIQLLKLYNKLISRLVDAQFKGTTNNNKAAGLDRHGRQRGYPSAPLPFNGKCYDRLEEVNDA